MININELRIGNFYISDCENYLSNLDDKFEKLGAIVKDDKWKGGYCLEATNGNKTAIANTKPILLTEEILTKCGFLKHKAFSSTFLIKLETYSMSPLVKLYAYLGNDGKVSSARIIQGNNKNGNMLPVLYIHQLQNLYFALTGKELEVNL